MRIKALDIAKDMLLTLWYENEEGDKFVPDFEEGMPDDVPKEYTYQVSQFPTQLTTNYLRILDDGTSEEVAVGYSDWPEDLVLAMVESGDFSLSAAILIGSQCCDRCLNALCYEYGLDDGYQEGSEEWERANTECEFCK